MSMFDDNRYCWRETYLVMHDRVHRPLASDMVRKLSNLKGYLEICNIRSDSDDLLDSLVILARNDSAAVEMQYHEGDTVVKEFTVLADEMERHELSSQERKKIVRARNFSAKIELLHFEQMQEDQIRDINAKKHDFPVPLKFPRYSHFVNNLICENHRNESGAIDESDAFDWTERLDPNILIKILKLVTRLTLGIAFDPAGGIVL